MGMRKGKISMKIKNLLKRIAEYSEDADKKGLESKYVFSVLDNEKKCKIIIGSVENKRTKVLDERQKKEEELKVLTKDIINQDFILVQTSEYSIPIISLDAEDLAECRTKFLIVKNENIHEIIGIEIIPIFYNSENKELIIMHREIKIEREQIISEIKLNKTQSHLMLKEKNYIFFR